MEPAKTSVLSEITEKLRNNIEPSFWKGRGNRESFRKNVKELVVSGILSKEEYTYLLKNERRILVKTQLIHLIPELQSQEIIETTLKHLSNVVLEKRIRGVESKRASNEKEILLQINEHLKETYHPKISTGVDAFSILKQLIEESSDITKELIKISNHMLEIRDGLLEKGHKVILLHEIDKISTQLIFAAKSNNPKDVPSRDELLNILKELQLKAES
ncbi:MAG: hypothetical protein KGD64_03570 [Candidatus Heimdallarchaeota archaeon]|nr:hypothetical protein [Candidatus Heimdallarchaeota archaeon]